MPCEGSIRGRRDGRNVGVNHPYLYVAPAVSPLGELSQSVEGR